MTVHAFSTALVGIEAVLVDVETQILGALKRFTVVGLADGVVREARERVRGALEHVGFTFPYGEVIVSLSPATLPKAGAGFDLSIAVTILAAMKRFDPARLEGKIFLGALGLDGSVRAVPGALASACCALAHDPPLELVLPVECAEEALLAGAVIVRPIRSLLELVEYLSGARDAPRAMHREIPLALHHEHGGDGAAAFADVIGQQGAKRALEIAAAGGHNLCMVGPPGSGKTMLAQRLRALLPPLSRAEALEVTKIYAAYAAHGPSGDGGGPSLLTQCRPFRAPHHTLSALGLVGGGGVPVPGEISLAHRGVLFLDELPELRREVIESLREPLERRKIMIVRAHHRIVFPADFMLVAAMNPCPCGQRGVNEIGCRCSPRQIARYVARISGPILDRIDMHIWVPPLLPHELAAVPRRLEEGGASRVARARHLQQVRLGDELRTNSSMVPGELQQHCALDSAGLQLMVRAAERLKLSARGYARVLKVARTVADLSEATRITTEHLAEALSYRVVLQA